jgi:hypothetical protein
MMSMERAQQRRLSVRGELVQQHIRHGVWPDITASYPVAG